MLLLNSATVAFNTPEHAEIAKRRYQDLDRYAEVSTKGTLLAITSYNESTFNEFIMYFKPWIVEYITF